MSMASATLRSHCLGLAVLVVLCALLVGASKVQVPVADDAQHQPHRAPLPTTTLPIAFQSDQVNITASTYVYIKGGYGVHLGDEQTPVVSVDYNSQFVPPFTKGDGTIRGLKCPIEGAVRHNVPNDGVNPPELCYCVDDNGSLVYYCVALSRK
jgi:hypothetical protein